MKKVVFVSAFFVVSVALVSNAKTGATSASAPQTVNNWHGCDPKGATQVTYNVRPNGDWEFSVNYCCGIGRCYKSGGGAATGANNVQHIEYSFNKGTGTMDLVNVIYFKN